MVAQGPCPRNRPAEEGGSTDEGSPRLFGPSRRPRLETPPVGANSDVSLDAAAPGGKGRGRATRRGEWSGPPGEEFAPDISASAGQARRSRPRVAGPVAREGMCGEQSPLPRTIATSRGDDNRDGPKRQHSDDRRSDRTDPTRQATAHGATTAQQPGGKPFQLDRPFQERTHRPTSRRKGEHSYTSSAGGCASARSDSVHSPPLRSPQAFALDHLSGPVTGTRARRNPMWLYRVVGSSPVRSPARQFEPDL